ncbi:hypothetical protein FB446DRAFT_701096 [Lentinula raphanica]|nr:hypothetical protein FB446DRAFT_701096 [Lentinula raphanica]
MSSMYRRHRRRLSPSISLLPGYLFNGKIVPEAKHRIQGETFGLYLPFELSSPRNVHFPSENTRSCNLSSPKKYHRNILFWKHFSASFQQDNLFTTLVVVEGRRYVVAGTYDQCLQGSNATVKAMGCNEAYKGEIGICFLGECQTHRFLDGIPRFANAEEKKRILKCIVQMKAKLPIVRDDKKLLLRHRCITLPIPKLPQTHRSSPSLHSHLVHPNVDLPTTVRAVERYKLWTGCTFWSAQAYDIHCQNYRGHRHGLHQGVADIVETIADIVMDHTKESWTLSRLSRTSSWTTPRSRGHCRDYRGHRHGPHQGVADIVETIADIVETIADIDMDYTKESKDPTAYPQPKAG